MEEGKKTGNRPGIITAICVLMGIGAVFTLFTFFMPGTKLIFDQIGAWYAPYLLFSLVVGLVSTYGLWTMKKWSVYLYGGMTLLSQVVMAVMGIWTLGSLVIPGIVVAITYSYLSQME